MKKKPLMENSNLFPHVEKLIVCYKHGGFMLQLIQDWRTVNTSPIGGKMDQMTQKMAFLCYRFRYSIPPHIFSFPGITSQSQQTYKRGCILIVRWDITGSLP